MAEVFQIVQSDEPALHNVEWHAAIAYPSPRTVCGVQLEGDDGVRISPSRQGRVTCPVCYAIIDEIQAIKRWR